MNGAKIKREKVLLSPADMAERMGYSVRQMQRLAQTCFDKNGNPLAVEKTSGGHFRFRYSPVEQSDVNRWIERHRNGTTVVWPDETTRPDEFIKAIVDLPRKISFAFRQVEKIQLSTRQKKQLVKASEGVQRMASELIQRAKTSKNTP